MRRIYYTLMQAQSPLSDPPLTPGSLLTQSKQVPRSSPATSGGRWGSAGLAVRPQGVSVCPDWRPGGQHCPPPDSFPAQHTEAAELLKRQSREEGGRREEGWRAGRPAAPGEPRCVCVCARAHAGQEGGCLEGGQGEQEHSGTSPPKLDQGTGLSSLGREARSQGWRLQWRGSWSSEAPRASGQFCGRGGAQGSA